MLRRERAACPSLLPFSSRMYVSSILYEHKHATPLPHKCATNCAACVHSHTNNHQALQGGRKHRRLGGVRSLLQKTRQKRLFSFSGGGGVLLRVSTGVWVRPEFFEANSVMISARAGSGWMLHVAFHTSCFFFPCLDFPIDAARTDCCCCVWAFIV